MARKTLKMTLEPDRLVQRGVALALVLLAATLLAVAAGLLA